MSVFYFENFAKTLEIRKALWYNNIRELLLILISNKSADKCTLFDRILV